jgi:hypothetical protein
MALCGQVRDRNFTPHGVITWSARDAVLFREKNAVTGSSKSLMV